MHLRDVLKGGPASAVSASRQAAAVPAAGVCSGSELPAAATLAT